MSVAQDVRDHVQARGSGAFLHSRDVPGPRNVVNVALHRMARSNELVRVRPGLYWVPDGRRSRPSPQSVALELGGPGSGPSGVSAARMLGLTTQVPAVSAMAVPGRVPDPLPGVQFRERPFGRRETGLRPMEVAVLEVMRAFHAVSEEPMSGVADAVGRAVAQGRVRPEVVSSVAERERDVAARERWAEVSALVGAH